MSRAFRSPSLSVENYLEVESAVKTLPSSWNRRFLDNATRDLRHARRDDPFVQAVASNTANVAATAVFMDITLIVSVCNLQCLFAH